MTESFCHKDFFCNKEIIIYLFSFFHFGPEGQLGTGKSTPLLNQKFPRAEYVIFYNLFTFETQNKQAPFTPFGFVLMYIYYISKWENNNGAPKMSKCSDMSNEPHNIKMNV